mgnify:CR=1 FL=1|jgi:hypothetical protein
MAKTTIEIDAVNKKAQECATLIFSDNMDDLHVGRDQYILDRMTEDEYIFKRLTK